MNHRHNHKVPIVHNNMHWVPCSDTTLVLEPMGHYMVALDSDGGWHYAVWLGEEVALYRRKFQTPIPYVAKVLDPRGLGYAPRR